LPFFVFKIIFQKNSLIMSKFEPNISEYQK
jgi:hypothetical protein